MSIFYLKISIFVRNLKTFTLFYDKQDFLRIKIIQILYAFYKGEKKTALMVEKELFHSIEKTYDLYYHLLNLAVLITDYADSRIEYGKNKLRPTLKNSTPTRFIDNKFVAQLRTNKQFTEYLTQRKLSWANHPEIIKELYEEILRVFFKNIWILKIVIISQIKTCGARCLEG